MTYGPPMGDTRTAVVTGAAGGIGRALAELLSERGYRMCLFDIDGSALELVASDLDAEVVVQGDVADPVVVQEFADSVGVADLLCLNAGVISASTGAPWEASPEEWDRVLGVNVFGVVNGLRSFIPPMLGDQVPRQILITASLAGATTWPGGGPYAASKHAVLAVAEQTALGLADTRVQVTVLCPALVRTSMSEHGEDPRDVASGALRALDAGRFAVIPEEWTSAVVARSEHLVRGDRPELPEPSR